MTSAWSERLRIRPIERPWTSRGYLPHFDHVGETQHIVFRLVDSLPARLMAELDCTSPRAKADLCDQALDAGHGARWLSDPRIASEVDAALRFGDGARYHLDAWCVMPTHVHVMARFSSAGAMARVVHDWKSFTARRANALLRRSGAFWAREYFDRAARSEEDAGRMIDYVEANPVTAHLCSTPEDWPFSSARFREGR